MDQIASLGTVSTVVSKLTESLLAWPLMGTDSILGGKCYGEELSRAIALGDRGGGCMGGYV